MCSHIPAKVARTEGCDKLTAKERLIWIDCEVSDVLIMTVIFRNFEKCKLLQQNSEFVISSVIGTLMSNCK